MGFGSVIGFIESLQLVTASKDYALTVLHSSQITIGLTRSSQSVTVFTSRCLVMDPTMFSASGLMFLPAGDSLTTNSLLQLSNSQGGGHLTSTFYSFHCLLKALFYWQLAHVK
jgi:hypothetical protein